MLGAAIGVMTGGLMQFLVQVPGLCSGGFRYQLVLSFRDPAFRRAMALFVPVAIGLSGSRISFFVNTMLISSLPEKSLSWLESAYRIMHLPLGLFGIAIGAVALPAFSRFVLAGDAGGDPIHPAGFPAHGPLPDRPDLAPDRGPGRARSLRSSMSTASSPPPTAPPRPRSSSFTCSGCRSCRSCATWRPCSSPTRTPARPMIASFVAVGCTIVLNLSLKGVLGIRAFPLSATISAVVNAGLLFVLLPRKIGSAPRRAALPVFRADDPGRLCGGGAAYGDGPADRGRLLGPGQIGPSSARSPRGSLAGAVVFYAASQLLGLTEVKAYVRRFLRLR